MNVATLKFKGTFREVRRFGVLRFGEERFDELIQHRRKLLATFISVAFKDLLGLLQKIYRLHVLMQCCCESRQMAQTFGDLKMIFAECLNADFQRLVKQRPSFVEAVLVEIKLGELLQGGK